MNLLIIGGTNFVGPALVAEALAKGHRVALFNRGRSQPDFRVDAETIIGDRETDLHLLSGRSWDAVIDTCGYLPRLVQLSAQALRDSVEQYCFISTLSVYPMLGAADRDESAVVMSLADESAEDMTNETYGPLKARCEAAVQAAFPRRNLMIRSGLIVGPRDPTNRFTYWVTRAAKGGHAIAPPARQPVQFIDVRDLAAFTLRQVEARACETYNVCGPARRITFGELLSLAKDTLGSDVHFHHVSDAVLQNNDVGEFMELPLWVNRKLAESFMTFNNDKALRDGLSFRPPEQTIRDTWEWARTLPADTPKPADLPPEKELELLAAIRS